MVLVALLCEYEVRWCAVLEIVLHPVNREHQEAHMLSSASYLVQVLSAVLYPHCLSVNCVSYILQ